MIVNKLESFNGSLRWTVECNDCQAIQAYHTRGKFEAELFQRKLRRMNCNVCGAGPKDKHIEAESFFEPEPFMSFRTGISIALVIGLSMVAAAYLSS